jgi:hypothetical protein
LARSYHVVQEILEHGAAVGAPDHDGHERFWLLPLEQFLAIGSIYGIEVIAPVGPDRGARSGLIQALRGEGPFAEDFDRMPRGLPPIPDDKIDYIQQWIDEGCPE